MRPAMKAVVSSNVKAVGYDSETRTLHVEFNDGSRYEYYNVPEDVFAAFMGASSKGSFVWQHLRDRYRYKKTN